MHKGLTRLSQPFVFAVKKNLQEDKRTGINRYCIYPATGYRSDQKRI